VYTRVLRPGSIHVGDAVRLLSTEEAARDGEVRA
jgi:MOSC domain-containing protein YiiM